MTPPIRFPPVISATASLPARLAKEPVAFRMLAQIAGPGDSTKDATVPWPEDRKLVDMGTLTLTKAVPDSAEAEKALLFMPNNLPDGVEVSADPLIDARVKGDLLVQLVVTTPTELTPEQDQLFRRLAELEGITPPAPRKSLFGKLKDLITGETPPTEQKK